MIKQVPVRPLSGGSRDILQTKVLPPEIESRTHLRFERDLDDLDWHWIAAYSSASVGVVHLISYERSPNPGTIVRVSVNQNARQARKEVAAALQLSEPEIDWEADFEDSS